jgi:CHAD domain-containing protein
MQIATESERKYDVPEDFTLPDLAGAAGVEQIGDEQVHELDATYFDTEDLRLARHHMTLRRRTGGSDAGWHLKTPGDAGDRIEHRLPLGDGDEVPAELVAEVRAVVRDRPLRPVARLRTRRLERPLRDAGGQVLALVALDEVRAESSGAEQRWREVEVELVDGGPQVLDAVDGRLASAGARPAGGPSKLARALGDRLRAATAGDGNPATGRKQPAAVRAVLDYVRVQRDAIVANDRAVRHGDADAVHDMRVATRRLRSTLRTFQDLWEREHTERLRAELKWLAERLGGVRDRQVMQKRLARAVAAEPPEVVVGPVGARIDEHLAADLAEGQRGLREALDDSRYFRLLDALDALVVAPPVKRVGGGWVRRQVRRALQRADRMLDEADERGRGRDKQGDGHDEEQRHHRDERLHESRKAYKRARYAVEVLGPRAGKPARRLVARLTDLQDVLGTHQDTAITGDLLREYAARAHAAGENGFTYGLLHAHQQDAGEAVLADLPAARQAARRRKLRRWLR